MSFKNQMRQKQFSVTPAVNAPRSVFRRSHNLKDTFDFDYLVPIFCDEILPGDDISLKMSTFSRLATQVVPFMDTATLLVQTSVGEGTDKLYDIQDVIGSIGQDTIVGDDGINSLSGGAENDILVGGLDG